MCTGRPVSNHCFSAYTRLFALHSNTQPSDAGTAHHTVVGYEENKRRHDRDSVLFRATESLAVVCSDGHD